MQAFVVQLSPLLSAVTAGIKTTVGLHSEARGKPKYPIQRKPIEGHNLMPHWLVSNRGRRVRNASDW